MSRQSDFIKGRKYRVVKEGATLQGMQPIAPYAQTGWAQKLKVGDVLVCGGVSWTFGDGVPIVKWLNDKGEWIANDCEFRPTDSNGSMWTSAPADGYLELID